jgi:exodeoxyribonuclease VII large subunit
MINAVLRRANGAGAPCAMRLWSSRAAPALASRRVAMSAEAPLSVVWSVAALVRAVADALQARFASCAVRGEISGFSRAASGHCYFNLKDSGGEAALVRCAMFRRAASLLDFAPTDGQEVEVRGRLAVYEPRGELQLIVEAMTRSGDGALYERFLRLKARLEAEGLFDAARKRELPAYVQCVGVVTSLAAAALRDVLSALSRRAPHVAVIVYPSPVQGTEAPAELVKAIERASQRNEVDLLIVCRGGGSLEDLWSFNDERVVRAIAASPLPIVCGVGHETDITLADFAADLRAPTPTAAAELAAPAREELSEYLLQLARSLARAVVRQLDSNGQRLDRLALQLARPAERIARHAQVLDSLAQRRRTALRQLLANQRLAQRQLAQRLMVAGGGTLERLRLRIDAQAARLAALDPRRVMSRGYAWVTDASGRPLSTVRDVKTGELLRASWDDGSADARVERIERKRRRLAS